MPYLKISPNPDAAIRCRHSSGDPDCECRPECPECGMDYDPVEGHDCLDSVPVEGLREVAKSLRDQLTSRSGKWSSAPWDAGDQRSYQGRRLTRITKVRDACRAAIANPGE